MTALKNETNHEGSFRIRGKPITRDSEEKKEIPLGKLNAWPSEKTPQKNIGYARVEEEGRKETRRETGIGAAPFGDKFFAG